jgi:hypothetical protein
MILEHDTVCELYNEQISLYMECHLFEVMLYTFVFVIAIGIISYISENSFSLLFSHADLEYVVQNETHITIHDKEKIE